MFLHATFEDVLRSMARQRIAASQSLVLDDIPLVGTSRSGRAEKFFLGELDGHRGKTVDQLIQESVENYTHRPLEYVAGTQYDHVYVKTDLERGSNRGPSSQALCADPRHVDLASAICRGCARQKALIR